MRSFPSLSTLAVPRAPLWVRAAWSGFPAQPALTMKGVLELAHIARDITWLAFGRAVVAVSPYVEAIRPKRADAMLLRLGREMAYLPDAVEQLLRLRAVQEPKEQR